MRLGLAFVNDLECAFKPILTWLNLRAFCLNTLINIIIIPAFSHRKEQPQVLVLKILLSFDTGSLRLFSALDEMLYFSN